MTTTDVPASAHPASAAPVHIPVPVLESPRLILRGHRAGDLGDSLALWGDAEVVRHITGKPQGREEVWSRVLRYIGHWAVTGYGFWHVRERATDRFVGEVGIADFQREIAVSFDGAPEAGWAFVPSAHGKGYATEAMTTVFAWSDAAHPRTACIISPENAGSLRVAARLGFREIARAEYKTSEVIVLERLARRGGVTK